MATITPQDITLYIQIGEALVPVVTAAYDTIKGFIDANGGNTEALTQLAQNKATIAQDAQTIAAEIGDAGPSQ